MFTPYNSIYTGYVPQDEFIKEIEKLIYINRDLLKINLENKNFIIPAIIVDVDDDNFTIQTAQGKNLEQILGYLQDKSYVSKTIDLPCKKSDYPDLYALKDYIVFVGVANNKPLKIMEIFKDKLKYRGFDFKYIQRLEYFMNIFDGMKISPYEGEVKEVGSDYVKIEDNTIDGLKEDLICVKVNDVIKKGDLVEKSILLNYNSSYLEVTLKQTPTIDLEKFIPITNIIIKKG